MLVVVVRLPEIPRLIVEFCLALEHKLFRLASSLRMLDPSRRSFLRQDGVGSLLVLPLLLDSVLLRIILPLLVELKSLFAATANLLGSLLIK